MLTLFAFADRIPWLLEPETAERIRSCPGGVRDGKPAEFKPFLSGFLAGNQYPGRPTGLAIDTDGSVLVSDDANGVIYRVLRRGHARANETRA